MPAECPNCRRPVSLLRTFSKPAWGRWNCRGCGALIGIDMRRRFLGLVPWTIVLLVLIKVVNVTSMGLLLAIPVIVLTAAACFYLIDRVVLIERTGFLCTECGYDLYGQTEPRCPECGAPFDLALLAQFQQLQTPDQPTRRRRGIGEWIGIALLILVFSATLVLGILVARKRGGGGAPPASPPAATPGDSVPVDSDT